MDEEVLLEKRSDILKRVMQFFDSFSIFINKIVEEVLKLRDVHRLSEAECLDLLYTRLMETYMTHNEQASKELEMYVKEAYILGLESIEEDQSLSSTDIGALIILFRLAQQYVHKAERDFLTRAALHVTEGKALWTAKQYQNRFDLIMVSEATRSLNTAIIVRTTPKGAWLKFHTVHDERVCPICNAYDGKVYYPSEAWHILPVHPNCFSSDTEVYTINGWEKFSDLEGKWQITPVLSLDPDTFNVEWIHPINYIKYHYKGEMIHFNSKIMDSMVTPDHQSFIGKRSDQYDRTYRKWVLKDSKDVKRDHTFYRSSKWVGEERGAAIGNKRVPIDIFCKFMGYYLSEGSCTKRNNKGYYMIKIAQSNKEKRMKIWNDLKDFPFNKYLAVDYIGFSGKGLGEFLLHFGHAHEKYIPWIIRILPKEKIRLFLDAYLLGDGSIKKGKLWKGTQFRDSKSYFTSSKKIADVLGELIIKVGNSVSYRLMKTKGKQQKFRNGVYTINHDQWVINENYGTRCSPKGINKVDYDGFVYDVELPKNHVLLTRRNGKVIWSGNCRCYLEVLSMDEVVKEI